MVSGQLPASKLLPVLTARVGCSDGCGGGQHHPVPFKVDKTAEADELRRAVSTPLKVRFIRLNARIYPRGVAGRSSRREEEVIAQEEEQSRLLLRRTWRTSTQKYRQCTQPMSFRITCSGPNPP
jgi:hypothetical protein